MCYIALVFLPFYILWTTCYIKVDLLHLCIMLYTLHITCTYTNFFCCNYENLPTVGPYLLFFA